jgi:dipeptidase
MCDTLLASREITAGDVALFAKNSDRQRNEAQVVEHFAAATYAAGATVTCTYITIPQVRRTHAVLLCRPYWIWGAEMGANEHGVAIGNQALFARAAEPRKEALIGMDLVRLALERAETAGEALEVITSLLEAHDQGGNCGHLAPAYYHNGFIIADAQEAFVLETVGKEWMLERVRGVRSLSNGYSIEQEAERTSAGLPARIRECRGSVESTSNYARALADSEREHLGSAAARRTRSTYLMTSQAHTLSSASMMRILRDHGCDERRVAVWHPAAAVERTVCMHSTKVEQSGQTVGSLISELHGRDSVHWVTATSAPCLSIFKPIFAGIPVPPHGPRPTDQYDPRSLWWRHERLHRAAVLGEFTGLIDGIRAERDALEALFRSRVTDVMQGGGSADRERAMIACWAEALDMEERWQSRITATDADVRSPYHAAWDVMNRRASIDIAQKQRPPGQ